MVPVTILTGWLGAGKSTLLQYIMHQPHGIKTAIIMNEFGDDVASLEQHRVIPTDSSDGGVWLNLPNGCICCAGVDRGLRAIEDMLLANGDVEWVLLEASGMADPCSLVRRLWSDAGSASYLDGVVCVVDASRLHLYNQSLPQCRQEAVKQAAVADILVINKCDLLPEGSAIDDSCIVNPTAKRIKTVNSSVPLTHLFGLNAYSGRDGTLTNIMDGLQLHSPDTHPQWIKPLYLNLPKQIVVDFNKFEDWLFSLLWEGRLLATGRLVSGKIYRVKGHVYDGQRHRYIQAVEQVYDATVIDPKSSSTTPPQGTFILMIGEFTAAESEAIKDCFYAAFS